MCLRTEWGYYVAADAALPLFPVRYSPDSRYRYTLWRSWAPGPWLAVVGLNPSTATELVLDPTVSRCVRLAQTTGHGAMCMLNLFGFRSPEPAVMKAETNPVGTGNDLALATVLRRCSSVLVAWGSHGLYRRRADEVLDLLALLGRGEVVRCLGTNRDGTPRHPLNTTLGVVPEPYQLARPDVALWRWLDRKIRTARPLVRPKSVYYNDDISTLRDSLVAELGGFDLSLDAVADAVQRVGGSR